MSAFRKKPVVIEAAHWFKNGDHPRDESDGSVEGKIVRYFRRRAASLVSASAF